MHLETTNPHLVLAAARTGAGIHASRAISAGEAFYHITGAITVSPTRMSMQIARSLHIEPGDAAWQYINHACEPNLVIDFAACRFVAVREIAAGEELSWNYLTTEWGLSAPFACGCGAHRCVRTIAGFGALDAAERAQLGDVAPHLRLPGPAIAAAVREPARQAA